MQDKHSNDPLVFFRSTTQKFQSSNDNDQYWGEGLKRAMLLLQFILLLPEK